MAQMGLAAFETAISFRTESLRGTAIRLQLRHRRLLFDLARGSPA
jgi:hypothetical protein